MMGFYNVRKIFFLSVLFPVFSHAGKNCRQEAKCVYDNVHGLKGADCYNKDFREFPKCLHSDVEIVDLSYNRIRKVSNEDLKRYSYVKHLYLMDNLLVNLDDDTFENINSLETLGLSMNSITKLPYTVFHLPSLKTLYLSQNMNINIIDAIEKAKPISSPLTQLDISYISDKDTTIEFPDFGKMPMLALLNVTGNQYETLTPKHFAGLCNLQILDNVNVTVEYFDDCDCWIINNWLKERKVKFNTFICSQNQKDCADRKLSEDSTTIFQECRQTLEAIERTSRIKKIFTGIGIATGIILVIVIVFFWMRRKRNHKKTIQKNIEMSSNITHTEQLLNNKSYPKNM